MPIETLLTMIIALGAVWGGFAVVLFTALKKEQSKNKE